MLEVALAIPYWLELAATIAGAIFGALSAVRAKYDIFGVCCIAIVVGLAGGITRDILLQDYGIYAFQKPNLILACIAAGIVVFYFGKLMTYFDPLMDFLDNLSVALWAIIGTGKALSAGLDLVPAVILGTVTANGGGIVRDICMNREPEAFQAGTVYVSAALIGALAFAVMKSEPPARPVCRHHVRRAGHGHPLRIAGLRLADPPGARLLRRGHAGRRAAGQAHGQPRARTSPPHRLPRPDHRPHRPHPAGYRQGRHRQHAAHHLPGRNRRHGSLSPPTDRRRIALWATA